MDNHVITLLSVRLLAAVRPEYMSKRQNCKLSRQFFAVTELLRPCQFTLADSDLHFALSRLYFVAF